MIAWLSQQSLDEAEKRELGDSLDQDEPRSRTRDPRLVWAVAALLVCLAIFTLLAWRKSDLSKQVNTWDPPASRQAVQERSFDPIAAQGE